MGKGLTESRLKVDTSTQATPVATDYLNKVITLRNAKYFGTVQSGRCEAVTITEQGVQSVNIEGIGDIRVADDSDYQQGSHYYWNIESVL